MQTKPTHQKAPSSPSLVILVHQPHEMLVRFVLTHPHAAKAAKPARAEGENGHAIRVRQAARLVHRRAQLWTTHITTVPLFIVELSQTGRDEQLIVLMLGRPLQALRARQSTLPAAFWPR